MSLVNTTLQSSREVVTGAIPDLTVSIHAHNAARHIKQTLAHILDQDDVRLEIIVVDDASVDTTSAEVVSISDSRVKLLRNEHPVGVPRSHMRALDLSRATFFAQMSAEDFVLPGALSKLLRLCREPGVGMVHCFSFEVDEKGYISREAFRRQRALVLNNSSDSQMDSIRLYNKAALERDDNGVSRDSSSGQPFDLRVSEQFVIKRLPEFLCARRLANPSVQESRQQPPETPDSQARSLRDRIKSGVGRARHFRWQLWNRISNGAYSLAANNFSWWPIGSFLTPRDSKRQKRNIAYYLWHFPVLSQTFVNRELLALKQSGLQIEIFADGAENVDLAGDDAKQLLDHTHYLDPPVRDLLKNYGRPLFRQNPLRFLNLLFFVITRQHDAHKSLSDDLYLFARAAYLAHFLKERKIDHVHAPWADKTSYVALIAARLSGITYSVQARAHDIHRKSYLYVLREKFENAEFVVTNTRYNQTYLQSLVSPPHREKIKLVYNGLDLSKFTTRQKTLQGPVRLLCVARLIEQKGLSYLLEALATLKDKGFTFICEIVGGPERPLYTNYLIQLKKLHRKLELEDCVKFVGPQPFNEVMLKYGAADIFVLPCVIARDGSRDITPNSLIEAMAMKLPVISTTVTGIPEIVEDGVSGLLVKPNDQQALAEALENLIMHPELRAKLGEEARKRVEERFDINRNVEKRLELFGNVIRVERPEGKGRS